MLVDKKNKLRDRLNKKGGTMTLTLREANKKLEQLANDYNYWLREKEIIQSIVLPKATDTQIEKVDGGKRTDRMLQYVETLEEKQINETLNYIFKKKQNLLTWIDNELKRLKKYGEVVALIVQLKENTTKIDEKTKEERFLTWREIGDIAHLDPDYCRQVYRKYKKRRYVN